MDRSRTPERLRAKTRGRIQKYNVERDRLGALVSEAAETEEIADVACDRPEDGESGASDVATRIDDFQELVRRNATMPSVRELGVDFYPPMLFELIASGPTLRVACVRQPLVSFRYPHERERWLFPARFLLAAALAARLTATGWRGSNPDDWLGLRPWNMQDWARDAWRLAGTVSLEQIAFDERAQRLASSTEGLGTWSEKMFIDYIRMRRRPAFALRLPGGGIVVPATVIKAGPRNAGADNLTHAACRRLVAGSQLDVRPDGFDMSRLTYELKKNVRKASHKRVARKRVAASTSAASPPDPEV